MRRLEADEIHDEAFDRHLPPELRSVQPPVAQLAPERSFE
jgi:hypothetical protein